MKYYHMGTVVEDLDKAVAYYGTLGVSFTRTRQIQLELDVGGTVTQVEILAVYSKQGEPYLELIQEISGGVWARTALSLDHIGIWSDDVLADLALYQSAGYTIGLSNVVPEGVPPTFAYLRSPDGLWTELISTSTRPKWESWLTTTHQPGDSFVL